MKTAFLILCLVGFNAAVADSQLARACLIDDPDNVHVVARVGDVVAFQCEYAGSKETSLHVAQGDRMPINLNESLVLYGPGYWVYSITSLKRKGEVVIIEAQVHTPDDPFCCASGKTTIRLYPEHFELSKAPTNVPLN